MAQTISYEVTIALVLITVLILAIRFDLEEIFLSQKRIWSLFVLRGSFVVWVIIILAETNRAPFDFAEGESELVSGFNIEYGRGKFVLLFLAEYIRILFISALTRVLFIHSFFARFSGLRALKILGVSFLFLWVRGRYPRMRYDVLISLT